MSLDCLLYILDASPLSGKYIFIYIHTYIVYIYYMLYMYSNYFLPVCGLTFHFLKEIFPRVEIFNFS